MWKVLTSGVIWACLATATTGREIYVNNASGDDHLDGRGRLPTAAAGGPVRTISKALRVARAGDAIRVANTGRPYREAISLTGPRHGGSENKPFVLDGGGATLDGSVSMAAGGWQYEGDDVYCFRPTLLGYQQLLLGNPGRAPVAHPASEANVNLPPLAPLEWCLWRGQIHFRVEPDHWPPDYEPRCCGLATGITLYEVADVVVENFVIQGFQIDGVAASDNVRGAVFRGLTAQTNGRGGISVRGSSRVDIDHCLLAGNARCQLATAGNAHVTVSTSKLDSASAPAVSWCGGEVTIDGRRNVVGER